MTLSNMPIGIYKRNKPPWNKGLKYKNPKVSIANKGKTAWNKGLIGYGKGHKMSEESKRSISLKNSGRKKSKEARMKMSIAKKKLFSDKTKHPNWKGGISQLPYTEYRRLLINSKPNPKKWLEEFNAKMKVYVRNRRLKKKNIGGSHSNKEWEIMKKDYNYMCACCKKFEPYIKLTEDHIIPIHLGGNDYISNIQPLCRSCNSKKRITIIKYDKSN